jgi:FAD-dependent oxidoreductase domain-containing protein 1
MRDSVQTASPPTGAVTAPVLIVGGGVMGCATAYFLAAGHGIAATVVERDPTYTQASSALSASSIRQQFSTPVNIALSRWSFDFLQRAPELLAVGGDAPPISLVERGYLYLASANGLSALQDKHRVQRAQGADIRWLAPAALAAQFPWLSTEGIAAATWGAHGEGWFDGPALHQALRRKAAALGVRFVHDEIATLQPLPGPAWHLQGRSGARYHAPQVVLATGAHINRLTHTLGVPLPVSAKKRDVFVFDAPARLDCCPLVIDPSGLWFRPEGRPQPGGGQRFLCGLPPRTRPGQPADPDDAPLHAIDHGLFDDVAWPALAARVPAFEALRLRSAWAGYYEMNTFDHNGLVGPLPGHEHLWVAAGFSGHGMQHAPAIGHALARLVAGQPAPEVAALALERIARNEPIVEKNVI